MAGSTEGIWWGGLREGPLAVDQVGLAVVLAVLVVVGWGRRDRGCPAETAQDPLVLVAEEC